LTEERFRQGDSGNDFAVQLIQSDGTPKNLTGYTVKFKMWTQGYKSTPKIDAAGTVTDAANGLVKYTFAANDLNTVGRYLGEFQIEKTGVAESTEPIDIIVEESPA